MAQLADKLRKQLETFFRGPEYQPLAASELAERLDIPESKLPSVHDVLQDLQDDGIAVFVPGAGWFSPRREGWVVGRVSVARKGFGFVRPAPASGFETDVYVPARKLKDAFDGDTVLVRARPPKRRPSSGGRRGRKGGRGRATDARASKGSEGRVLHVLRRSTKVIVGIYHQTPHEGGGVVEPASAAGRDISIAEGLQGEATHGDVVLVRLVEGPALGGLPPGQVVEVSAPEGTWQADLQLIASEFELRDEFPAGVLDELDSLPADVSPEDWEGRVDRRGSVVFTIDPRDAKDFDDAVTVERQADGSFVLGVFIADVSHFVPEGSALDLEARDRATSVYLPGRVFPMLPEKLSNGLCSLRPDEDRLAKAVWMEISSAGELVSWDVERCVIRSCRRFTYGEVLELLDGGSAVPGEEPLKAMIGQMERLRKLLKAHRIRRGALALNLAQQRIILDDDGEVVEIGEQPRDRAHNLVEEFMLIANEAVARAATQREIAILRRCHPEPPEEDVDTFLKFCRVLVPGIKAKDVGDLQRVVERVQGKPVEPMVNLGLLRALTQAEYTPEAELHFALGTDEYCHFTSPIRRYPDLQVHRALDRHLFGVGQRGGGTEDSLDQLAGHCSQQARRAEEAEREMAKLRSIHWLSERMDQDYDGTIVHVSEFGFFVRLDGNLIEGMVHIRQLRDDFYEYDEEHYLLVGRRTRKVFRLGDRVRVEVIKVDRLRREIDLGLSAD